MRFIDDPDGRSTSGSIVIGSFSLEDMIRSEKASLLNIANIPPEDVLQTLYLTMAGMERIKSALDGFPITVTSGYRCKELNLAVGGSEHSQHTKGQACDFVCPKFGTPHAIAHFLSDTEMIRIIGIDQLIFEGTWVHASFTLNPRYEVLTKLAGERRYAVGLVR